MYKASKNTKTSFVILFITFIILEGLVGLAIDYIKKADIDNFLMVKTLSFKSNINIANNQVINVSKIFYDSKINTKNVRDIIYKASLTKDEKKLNILRNKLLHELSTTYKYMKNYHVRQLHFHLPQAISFLRFHRPNKYGDSLIKIRKTLEYVNKYKKPISIFEEGRIFNGFRNVYPLFKNGKFIGSVEISFSFDGLQDVLSQVDDTSYLFMVKNKTISKKVFQNEKSNYKRSEFDGFSYDKTVLKDDMEITLKQIFNINKEIAHNVQKIIDENGLFSYYYKTQNDSFIISFAPVSNLNDKVVAYIIHYEYGEFLDNILLNLDIAFWVLSALAFLLSGLFSSFIFNELKRQDSIHDLAVHDELTEIYNRHGVSEILNQKLVEFKRNKNDFSLIFLDIDHFKNVNDTYGHDIGDSVLVDIAKIINSRIRESDVFARWGGEEFIIFLPDTGLKNAIGVAEKLRKAIESHNFTKNQKITCSFGVVELKIEDTKESFLKRADELLYKAKENGRNRVEV